MKLIRFHLWPYLMYNMKEMQETYVILILINII
jgi:hypothetical protein